MLPVNSNEQAPESRGLQAEHDLAQKLTQLADSLEQVLTDLQQRNETSLRWEDQPALTQQINQIIDITKNDDDPLPQELAEIIKVKAPKISDLNQLIDTLKNDAKDQQKLVSKITPVFEGIVSEFDAILQRIDRLG